MFVDAAVTSSLVEQALPLMPFFAVGDEFLSAGAARAPSGVRAAGPTTASLTGSWRRLRVSA
ncbi:hypothetical protein [Streptomyces mirabilis]